MTLGTGQILRGSVGTYKVLNALKAPTVYKAQVLSGSRKDVGYAVVKTAASELESVALNREYQRYQVPDIASNPYIRNLYDTVGMFEGGMGDGTEVAEEPPCLVLEWMDTDLRCLPSQQFRHASHLPKIVSRSVLSALDVFKKHNLMHTDVNINNIFLSNTNDPSPTVKLGDLGMLIGEGYNRQRIQSLPCRAPEVWQGLGCFHASDVWSVGITLARCIYGRAMFGPSDKIIEGNTEAWCIAKLQRLVGPLGLCIEYQQYKDEFELAGQLVSMEFPEVGKLIKVGTWREELESLTEPPVSAELLDFIEHLLVIDMEKRPSAVEALKHPYVCPEGI